MSAGANEKAATAILPIQESSRAGTLSLSHKTASKSRLNFEKAQLEKLRNLLNLAPRIKLEQVSRILEISDATLIDFLLEHRIKGVTIDGDFLVSNPNAVVDLIDAFSNITTVVINCKACGNPLNLPEDPSIKVICPACKTPQYLTRK